MSIGSNTLEEVRRNIKKSIVTKPFEDFKIEKILLDFEGFLKSLEGKVQFKGNWFPISFNKGGWGEVKLKDETKISCRLLQIYPFEEPPKPIFVSDEFTIWAKDRLMLHLKDGNKVNQQSLINDFSRLNGFKHWSTNKFMRELKDYCKLNNFQYESSYGKDENGRTCLVLEINTEDSKETPNEQD